MAKPPATKKTGKPKQQDKHTMASAKQIPTPALPSVDDFLANGTLPPQTDELYSPTVTYDIQDDEKLASMTMPEIIGEIQVVGTHIQAAQQTLLDLSQYMQRLYKRFHQTENDFRSEHGFPSDKTSSDKRSDVNPEKNLKISAIRVFGWAKAKSLNASTAKIRATEKTRKAAQDKYHMDKLPESVLRYIAECADNYDNIKAQDVIVSDEEEMTSTV